ncbi:hypothetical protein [Planctobacterium marinum]|uniref:hypothetical protein n=1 Tax=Planctobacterium marinum TaxID=1631968 RepID=UPI001E4F9018|nr:hypothetical protein [Planctobacterium marinum]MCC2607033.1 hypothetical protein [Planctobacterium marinum]
MGLAVPLTLIETDKSLHQALYLNLVTTGGFGVIPLTSVPREKLQSGLHALIANHSLLPQLRHLIPPETLRIFYQPLFSNINEPCSFIREGNLNYHLCFSMQALPGFSEAVKQILMQN